jgi:large subunit ribosomal protein L4
MKLPVVDTAGKQLREIDVADDVFGVEANPAVVHQAYVSQMANRRAGSAHTKRRGEVEGSTAKIRKQKGLGRSRQGGIRASHHVGGGVAMGPRPRDFSKRMPRQMKRLAILAALSSHAGDGSLTVVEGIVPAEPKTKTVRESLAALGVERRALLVSGVHEVNLARAAANIAEVKAMPAGYLNVVDVVNAHRILMTEDAVRAVEALWGGESRKPARGKEAASA